MIDENGWLNCIWRLFIPVQDFWLLSCRQNKCLLYSWDLIWTVGVSRIIWQKTDVYMTESPICILKVHQLAFSKFLLKLKKAFKIFFCSKWNYNILSHSLFFHQNKETENWKWFSYFQYTYFLPLSQKLILAH